VAQALRISLTSATQGVPLDKSEGGVKDKTIPVGVFGTAFLPERVEDQDSGNLTLISPSRSLRRAGVGGCRFCWAGGESM
jgi:hypothetical protein